MSRLRPTDGFTLLEVMIVVAVLTTGLAFMIGQVYTLNKAQQASRQLARVQEITQIMAERLQGATWTDLGKEKQAWSWHRREGGTPSPHHPPMTEYATETQHSLRAQGILDETQPSGLDNLRVHVEYYKGDLLTNVRSRADLQRRIEDPYFRMPEQPRDFDLRNVLDDIVIRIILRWNSTSGGEQRHELMLTRRQ